MDNDSPLDPPEPRWPAMLALVAVGGLYMALPESLAVGPRWFQLVMVIVLLVPTEITNRRGYHGVNRILGHVLASVVTLFMTWSLVLLLKALPAHYRTTGDAAAFGRRAVDYEHSRVRVMVLAARRRRPSRSGPRAGAYDGIVFVSADDVEERQ